MAIESAECTESELKELTVRGPKSYEFLRQMKPENDWHYTGKGVNLGDSDTPIFWYRPEGSDVYRVIYGDLTLDDVEPENLPQ